MVGSEQIDNRLESAYQSRNRRIRKSANNKVVLDRIVKDGFLFLTLICASVVIVVTIFILFKGLRPFRKTYQENGHTGKASLSYFLSGLRFNNGYDESKHQFLFGVFPCP